MSRSFLFFFVVVASSSSIASVACGSRTPLPVQDEGDGGASIHVGGDAGPIDALDASSSDATRRDAAGKRCTHAGPLDGWLEVDVLLGSDFERLVASAAPSASEIWLAGGGRAAKNGATRLLRVEVRDAMPRVAEDMLLAGTEGWEPLALAVTTRRVALVARAAGGESKLAIYSRSGALEQVTSIASLEIDLRYRMEADVAWIGDDVIVAARRFGTPTDHFVVERRDVSLALRWSEVVTPAAFRLRPDGRLIRTSIGLQVVTDTGLRADPRHVAALSLIGAARDAWTGIDETGFVLERDGAVAVHGKWPGQSFGSNGYIPVYESAEGVFITGNVDLGPFIGWFRGSDLQWIGVPRLGGGGVAYGDAANVGLFFLGIEIPHPEQPLRYWGCTR